jgi:hypothetical protein
MTVRAATQESARALYNVLQQFHPELDSDEGGEYYVSVVLGSDRRVLEVLEAIEAFFADLAAGTVETLTVSLDGHSYRLHGEGTREQYSAI